LNLVLKTHIARFIAALAFFNRKFDGIRY
jgi:hypothetical protein